MRTYGKLEDMMHHPRPDEEARYRPLSGSARKAKGARQERRAKAHLEGEGYHVVKAGGSLGVFDLVALHPDYGIRLIQVKSNRKPGRQEMDALRAFQCHASWRKELWVYRDHAGVEITRL